MLSQAGMVSLSSEDVCFGLVLESHAIVCPFLSGVATDAIRASKGKGWIEAICACFSKGIGGHVKQRLEKNLPLEDMYAICKIFRCQINDIAAFGSGRCLQSPRDKERLSLQVLGVETARNWAFHGDCLSVGEVLSSIRLLTSIVVNLSGNHDANVSVKERLAQLLVHANELASCDASYKIFMPKEMVGHVLLYKGLEECKRELLSFLNERRFLPLSGETACNIVEHVHVQEEPTNHNFHTLMKRVRRAIDELRKRREFPLGKYKKSQDYTAITKAIVWARNTLAHRESHQLALPKVNEVLLHIQDLLSACGLSYPETDSALEMMSFVQEIDMDLCCCFINSNTGGLNYERRERILRPRGQHFVGRGQEMISIMSAFQEYTPSCKHPAVLIFGPAGIGKSFMAAEVANRLSNTFRRQAWLSCSNTCEFDEDLSQQRHLFSGFFQHTVTSEQSFIKPSSPCHIRNTTMPGNTLAIAVLDDVCSSTSHLAYDLITRHDVRAIITTRSQVVKSFLQRQAAFLDIKVVELKPFSPSESWQLIKLKAESFKTDRRMLRQIDSNLSGVLGNLPLCVSIYSSYLEISARQKFLDTTVFVDENFLKTHWRDIEEQFGDRIHVRGLTGVVECAEDYLQDHPLVVFLLAKICLTESEHIPWQVIGEISLSQMRWSGHTQRAVRGMEVSSKKLLAGLLGVVDWLFSKGGQTTLVECRNALEELGLINWDSTMLTVHIHRLIHCSAKTMLEKRSLFLNSLLAPMDTSVVAQDKMMSKRVAQLVSFEMLSQVMAKGAYLLNEAVDYMSNESFTHDTLSIFTFLANMFDKMPFQASRQRKHHFCFAQPTNELALALLHFTTVFGIQVSHAEFVSWTKMLRQKSSAVADRHEEIVRKINLLSHSREGFMRLQQDFPARARSSFQAALTERF